VPCIEGCGRGVHAQCVGVSKAHADLGRVRCADCRAKEMAGGGTPSSALVRSGVQAMLWEVSAGRHSTAQGRSEFARLEKEWAAAQQCARVVLPRDSEESFVNFLIWLAAESGRARSFVTVWRAAAGVLTITERTNWTKNARVKAVCREIEQCIGELAVPCTQSTRRLIAIMFGRTLTEACARARNSSYMLARSRLLTVVEVLGGLRVGEALGGGDGHGLLAPNCAILEPLTETCAELGTTIEAHIEDSKTGVSGRYVNFVGTSRTLKLEAERYLRELWAAGAKKSA